MRNIRAKPSAYDGGRRWYSACRRLSAIMSVEVVNVLGVSDLAKHFDLSERACHRRLTVIGGLQLPGVELSGKGYRISDKGLAIFGRTLELERAGSTIEEAAKTVEDELNAAADASQDNAAERRIVVEEPSSKVVDILESQIKRQHDEIEFLREQLSASQAQVHTLMLPASTDSRQRIGRLQALRIVLLGR